MCWGLQVGNGWKELIIRLSCQLEREIINWININLTDFQKFKLLILMLSLKIKWIGPRSKIRQWLASMIPVYPRVSQVKEKFGGLRFYMTFQTDRMDELIEIAEEESYTLCEECGKPGKPIGMWIRTLCPKCRSNYDKN
jgi:hypothetical protein